MTNIAPSKRGTGTNRKQRTNDTFQLQLQAALESTFYLCLDMKLTSKDLRSFAWNEYHGLGGGGGGTAAGDGGAFDTNGRSASSGSSEPGGYEGNTLSTGYWTAFL